MKSLLDHKADRLERQKLCPCCKALRRHFIKSPVHFRDAPASDRDCISHSQKACIAFDCGSEFAIDKRDNIICTAVCPGPSDVKAEEMNEEAHEAHEDDDAAGEAA